MEERWEPFRPWDAYQERLRGRDGWRRLWALAERYGFPATVGALLLGLLGALVLLDAPVAPGGEPDVETLTALAAAHEAGKDPRRAGAPPSPADAATATFSVMTEPAGAVVLLDQDLVGVTPLVERTVPAGAYALTVRITGYATVDTLVALEGGKPADFFISLDRRPAYALAEPPRTAPAAPRPSEAEAAAGAVTDFQARLAEATERAEADDGPPADALRLASNTSAAALQQAGGTAAVAPEHERPRRGGRAPVAAAETPEEPPRTRQDGGGRSESLQTSAPAGPADVSGRAGTLKVLVKPWGSIYIDGQLHQRETDVRYAVSLAPKAYRVTAVHPTLGTWERTVRVAAGAEASVVVDFNRPTHSPPISPLSAADDGGEEIDMPTLENR